MESSRWRSFDAYLARPELLRQEIEVSGERQQIVIDEIQKVPYSTTFIG
jgi:hypothetical protein